MENIQESQKSSHDRIDPFSHDQEENNLILLHHALLEITRTLDKCIELFLREETPDKENVRNAYNRLGKDHKKNCYASSVQTAFGFAQLGMIASGIDPNLSNAVGALSQAGTNSFKEFNQGRTQADDAYILETARKTAENRDEKLKQLRNLEERSRDSAQGAMNRAILAYEIRG